MQVSPLAGDINRMETPIVAFSKTVPGGPHSLGTLIEWKHKVYVAETVGSSGMSPLAGDINRMETFQRWNYT